MNKPRNIPLEQRNSASATNINLSDCPIPDDPKLIEEGWTRRYLADPDRAKEALELYSSMGFEVIAKKLEPTDLAPQCGTCAPTICQSFVMIYTRPKDSHQNIAIRNTSVHATKCLRSEHQVILRVLDCFEIALGRSQKSATVSKAIFDPFIEFFQGFADRCHHCKEENRLFPCLEKKGIPRDGGPIGVMLYEHEQGRKHVRTIKAALDDADSGNPVAINTVMDHGQQFLDLLRAHIGKENNVLFDMADNVVLGDDLSNLANEYAQAESEAEYLQTFDRCTLISQQLISEYSINTD